MKANSWVSCHGFPMLLEERSCSSRKAQTAWGETLFLLFLSPALAAGSWRAPMGIKTHQPGQSTGWCPRRCQAAPLRVESACLSQGSSGTHLAVEDISLGQPPRGLRLARAALTQQVLGFYCNEDEEVFTPLAPPSTKIDSLETA